MTLYCFQAQRLVAGEKEKQEEMEEQGKKGGPWPPLAGESERRLILGGLFWKRVDTPLHRPPASLSLPSSFLPYPPSLGKQGQQISLLFSAGPEEEDTWTALRVSVWSSHGPLLPLPLSVGEEAVIVPAPVSEEIGKSDVFVSHLHGDQEKRAGLDEEGVRRKSGRSREGVKGCDNGVAVASLWLRERSVWGCCDLLCVCVCVCFLFGGHAGRLVEGWWQIQ